MITPHPSAPLGIVQTLGQYSKELFQPPCAVLCRNNAPLVAFAYGLLQRNATCRILGRDIGAGLTKLVNQMRATNLDDVIIRLGTWVQRETDKTAKEGRNPERIMDQYNCIRFFVNGLDENNRTVASLTDKISSMFGEATDKDLSSRVVLCSIHRSKGLEWPTVFLLDRALIPSRFATQPWQRQQEANLGYVAVTRSMHTLYYINSECWKSADK